MYAQSSLFCGVVHLTWYLGRQAWRKQGLGRRDSVFCLVSDFAKGLASLVEALLKGGCAGSAAVWCSEDSGYQEGFDMLKEKLVNPPVGYYLYQPEPTFL